MDWTGWTYLNRTSSGPAWTGQFSQWTGLDGLLKIQMGLISISYTWDENRFPRLSWKQGLGDSGLRTNFKNSARVCKTHAESIQLLTRELFLQGEKACIGHGEKGVKINAGNLDFIPSMRTQIVSAGEQMIQQGNTTQLVPANPFHVLYRVLWRKWQKRNSSFLCTSFLR